MPRFKIIAVGTFCVLNDDGQPRKIKLSSGEPVAGFYAARIVRATDQLEAISRLADLIQGEIGDILNVKQNDYTLEIERCDELIGEPGFIDRGFAFFGEE